MAVRFHHEYDPVQGINRIVAIAVDPSTYEPLNADPEHCLDVQWHPQFPLSDLQGATVREWMDRVIAYLGE